MLLSCNFLVFHQRRFCNSLIHTPEVHYLLYLLIIVVLIYRLALLLKMDGGLRCDLLIDHNS